MKLKVKDTFFKNCGKFTDNTAIKGKLDKIVSESIMLLFYNEPINQDKKRLIITLCEEKNDLKPYIY